MRTEATETNDTGETDEQEVEVGTAGSYDRQRRKAAEEQAVARAGNVAFTIMAARSVLHEALVRASAAVAKKATLPIVTCALFETDGAETGPAMAGTGRARLTTTDFDQRLETSFGATILGAGSIALPARRLLEIVSSLPSASTVAIDVKGMKARVTAGRSKFDVPGFAAAEFPNPTAFKPVLEPVTIDAKTFLDGIGRVVACASDAESRPTFNSVLLESADEGVFVVACDGIQLARVLIAETSPFRVQCLIRRQAIGPIRSTFANDTSLTLSASGNDLRLEGKDSAMTTRLVEGPYPAYRMLFTSKVTRTAIVNAELLLAAIKRVALVTEGKREAIRMIMRANDIRFVAQSADNGRAEDIVECRYTEGSATGGFQIGMDARLITSVVEGVDADDAGEIALQMVSPERGMYVRPAKQLESLSAGIVMPLRLVTDEPDDEVSR